MKFRVLFGGHRSGDPAEATIARMAIAAINGLKADGQPMAGGVRRLPSEREVARECNLPLGATRRGIAFLVAADEVVVHGGGPGRTACLEATPAALAACWGNRRCRIRLHARVRSLPLRPREMLVAGLVSALQGENGQLKLGRKFLAERTGMPLRSLDRAMGGAASAGAIRTWIYHGQLFLAVGEAIKDGENVDGSDLRSPESNQLEKLDRPREGAADRPLADSAADWCDSGKGTGAIAAKQLVRFRRTTGAVPANEEGIASGGRRIHQEAEPAPPAGEPIRQQNAPAAQLQQSPAVGDVRAVAGAWAVEMTGRGIERMLPAIHAADVMRLLADVGTDPARVHNAEALARDRREAAKRIIAWCPSPERLARWCVVAVRRYRATNVAGYLRRAAERGDPGTMLARNGQGGGVLPRVVEGALRGEHDEDVQRLVAGGAAMRDAHATAAERVRLRTQLAVFLGSGRRDAAKRVLLQLVGSDRSDVALARAVDGVLTLEQAKGLLAA